MAALQAHPHPPVAAQAAALTAQWRATADAALAKAVAAMPMQHEGGCQPEGGAWLGQALHNAWLGTGGGAHAGAAHTQAAAGQHGQGGHEAPMIH